MTYGTIATNYKLTTNARESLALNANVTMVCKSQAGR